MPRGDQDVVLVVLARLYIWAVAGAVLVGGLSIPANGSPAVLRSADV